MRQLNPSTNLILTFLAGVGLLASLSLPWFAAPVTDTTPTDGPVERGAFQVSHVFTSHAPGAVSGTDALGGAQAALVGLVALFVLVALAVSTPSLRHHAEQLLRMLVMAAPVVLIVAIVAHPGTTTPVSFHYGALISFAALGFMANAAWHGANMREKKAAPVRPRYGS